MCKTHVGVAGCTKLADAADLYTGVSKMADRLLAHAPPLPRSVAL